MSVPQFVRVFGGVRFDGWDWRPEAAPRVVDELFAGWPERLCFSFTGKAHVAAYYPGDTPTRGRDCRPADVRSTLAGIAAKHGALRHAWVFLPVHIEGWREAAEAGVPMPAIQYSLAAGWNDSGLAITACVLREHVAEAFERVRSALHDVAGDPASRVRCGWLDTAEPWWCGGVHQDANGHTSAPFPVFAASRSEPTVSGYHPFVILSDSATQRLGWVSGLARELGEGFAVAPARSGDSSPATVRFLAGAERFGVGERRLLRSVLASELNLDFDRSRTSPRGTLLRFEFRPSWVLAEDWVEGPAPTFSPPPPWIVAEEG